MYLIWLLICFVVACLIRKYGETLRLRFTTDRDLFTIIIPIAFFVLFGLCAPSVYEYKNLPEETYSQFKILRDEEGIIVGLEKDGTGFHKPFKSETRFVQLYTTADWKKTFNYRLQDGPLISITYRADCINYPRIFVTTNGKFGNLFTQNSFNKLISAVDNSFITQLRNGVKLESTEKKFNSERELYEYARDVAKKWSAENQYATTISIYTDVRKTTDFNTFWSQP